jgi:hypothetical protein
MLQDFAQTRNAAQRVPCRSRSSENYSIDSSNLQRELVEGFEQFVRKISFNKCLKA